MTDPVKIRCTGNGFIPLSAGARSFRRGALLSACLVLAGCANGPASETAQEIHDRARAFQSLPPGTGNDPRSIVRSGLLLSPVVREQASRTDASVDEIEIQKAALLPSLSLGIVGGRGEAGAGDPDLRLSGKQVLVDFGGTKRGIAAADVNLQIQYIRFQEAVDTSIKESLVSYRTVAMLEEIVAVRAALLARMQELHKLIEDRIAIGASSAPDLLETRNRIQRAEFALLEVTLELSEARDRLERLTGNDRGGALPDFPEACSAPEGETDRQKVARLELVKARLGLEEAERARYPRISLNPIGRILLGGGGVASGVNISVDSLLVEGGAIRARQNAAANRQKSAEALVLAEERNNRLDEMRLKRQIATLKEKQGMLARQIDLLAQTRDLYRSQYMDLGVRAITDLLDIEENLSGRQADLVQARLDFQERQIQCAARSKILRDALGLSSFQIYGYPLTRDGF